MSKPIFARLIFLLKLGLLVCSFYYLWKSSIIFSVSNVISSVNQSILLLAIVLGGLQVVLAGWRWFILLNETFRAAEFIRSVIVTYRTLALSTVIPTQIASDGMRIFEYSSKGLSATSLLTLSLIDRVFSLFGFLLFAIPAITLFYPKVGVSLFGTLIPLFLYIFLSHGSKTRSALLTFHISSRLTQIPWARISWKYYATSCIISTVNAIATMTLIAKSLDVNIDRLIIFCLFSLVIIIGSIPISFNGLGTREVGAVLLLPLAGIDEKVAASISLVTWAVTMIVLCPGLLLWFLKRRTD